MGLFCIEKRRYVFQTLYIEYLSCLHNSYTVFVGTNYIKIQRASENKFRVPFLIVLHLNISWYYYEYY